MIYITITNGGASFSDVSTVQSCQVITVKVTSYLVIMLYISRCLILCVGMAKETITKSAGAGLYYDVLRLFFTYDQLLRQPVQPFER